MTTFPKMSIVTPSFNQGKFIEKTILSVIEQEYPNLEYIIIDGGSTDESVEIIKKYEKHLTYWVSEPDRGQSHAINKGFEKASGEIFGWLNSDDWYHPGALQAVAEAFDANPEAGAVVGAGDFYSDENNWSQTIEPFPVTVQSLYGAVDRFFMQPSCFFTNTAWKECGPIDESLHLAMDLDLWLKIAKKYSYATIETNLSVSLVHSSAKTTALAAQSLVDASLVIMRHGGEKEGRQRLVDFVQELYDVRKAREELQIEKTVESERFNNDKAQLIRENHELNRVIQSRDEKINALENSLSWRVTAPLRRLGHVFSVSAKPIALPDKKVDKSFEDQKIADLLMAQENIIDFKRDVHLDIILPIYNGFDKLVPCVQSVIKNSSNCSVILIDDCSSDPRVADYTAGLTDLPENDLKFIKLKNDINLGFVKTVNKAYQYTNNNFIILNSDTEVPPGWLDRISKPFHDFDNIATVTPFSNAATILSFPEPDIDNELFLNLDTENLDSFFSRFIPSEPIDIPTGVGFCMAINRIAVEKNGLFDEDAFDRGYGEENDFCMRASKVGYRNVLVPNLFVYHKHGGSFGKQEKNDLLRKNSVKLAAKHPDFEPLVQEFISRNPLSHIRSFLKLLITSRNLVENKRILLLDFNLGGGSTLYSRSLVSNLERMGHKVIVLEYRYASRKFHLETKLQDSVAEFDFVADTSDLISSLCQKFKIDSMIISQLVSWPNTGHVLKAIRKSGTPYVVLMHDYFMICPNWTLFDYKEKYCGIPDDPAVCATCLGEITNIDIPIEHHANVKQIEPWRTNAGEFLAEASKVICFSNASLQIVKKAYPFIANVMVNEHCIPEQHLFKWQQRSYEPGKRLTIAVIGGIGMPKGSKVLAGLINSAEFKKLPVQIVLIGDINPLPRYNTGDDSNFVLHGSYYRADLGKLLEQYDASIVMIPSLWPETFCYTASEAILLGYPVICFDVGAPAERVNRYNCGIVANEMSADALLSFFKHILAHPECIGDFSNNAQKYVPPTVEEHFEVVVRVTHNK